ncbi:MAG TPA: hypothetical protein VMR21_04120 [Vicinamibacteria bacterium]|nr:hypothetical protein [Vicinamibacteria bacterium]
MSATAAGVGVAVGGRPARREVLAVAGLALLARAVAVALSDRVVADVLRYRKVATHVLDVSWNPYLAPHLYPYPPVWVWMEAGAEWLARHAGVPFAMAVKAPVVLADVALAVLLVRWGHERGGRARWAGWLYAAHPVALLVTGFHGQFDPVALLALAAALRWLDRGRLDRSALALAAAIAVKSFPVLVLPFALLFVPGGPTRRRYAVLATGPVAVLLAPYAASDASALTRELLGYGGVADFGWIGAHRSLRWAATGRLARGEAEHWAVLVTLSKPLFLAAAAALWVAVGRGWLRWSAAACALAVLLAFQALYGALSAQYLLWPVPLALALGERLVPVHAVLAAVALVGFYVLLAPGVLTPAEAPLLAPALARLLWTAGTAGLWLLTVAWLGDLVRRGRRTP